MFRWLKRTGKSKIYKLELTLSELGAIHDAISSCIKATDKAIDSFSVPSHRVKETINSVSILKAVKLKIKATHPKQ